MKSKVNLQIIVGFTVALLLVIAVGLSSYLSFKQQREQADWVGYTYKVQTAANQLLETMVDMETGRRGYRATSNEFFLQPYNEGLAKLPAAQARLHSLVVDTINKKNLELIDEHVKDAVAFWRSLDDGIVKSGDALKNTTIEKEKMDAFRAAMHRFYARQDELLAIRTTNSNNSTNLAEWVLIIGTLITLLVVIVLLRFILSEFRTRKKAEAQVKHNYDKVVQLNIESDSRNWILKGVSDINDKLQGSDNLAALCSSIIEAILRYTNQLSAAMYVFDPKKSQLQLQAISGIDQPPAENVKPGESLVGKAANNKELSVIKIPAGYVSITAAGVHSDSANAVFIPLWLQNDLKGIIQVLSWNDFTENELSLFRLISNNVAISVNAAQAEAETKRLFEEVQYQKEELEAQQEELRQTNEELTRQSEELQASEEELKVQEEELRQINAELEEKNETVETAMRTLDIKAKELELTSKFKSEFLANMSHELRTPLNSILILAKLLKDNTANNLTQKQTEYAGIIYKSGNDLLELINDILDLSKIEAGKVQIELREVKIKSIEEDIRLTFEALAQQKQIQFTSNIDALLPESFLTDKQRLEQVIKNLLSNAFKFTSEGGSVELSFRLEDQSSNLIAIAVKDSGIGIPADKQQLIFQAFQQADGSTNRKYGGTGLGLSISKELMYLLGGKMELKSEPGKGSEFILLLPLDHITVPTASEQHRSESSSGYNKPANLLTPITDDRNTIQPGDRSMLVIEDDKNFATILRDFSRLKGYKTIVALAGDEGLNLAYQYHPSAIILDMGLPGMDGNTVLQHLKSNRETNHIPVHIISGRKDVTALEEKVVAWLEKPVSETDLNNAFEKIQQILHSQLRRVLVCSTDTSMINAMQQLIRQRNKEVDLEHVTTVKEAEKRCLAKSCDCIVVDMGKDVERELKHIKALKQTAGASSTPLIICVDKDISASVEMELKKLSDVVIRTSSSSNERLMEELELFLYKVEDNDTSSPQLKFADAPGTELAGKKVLLVDDDMRNVFSLNAALETHHVNVITASDGNEAIAALKEHNDVNLVLMDIMMPDMDGYEAIRHIRKKMGLVKLPIIALTAKAMSDDKEKVLEAGASDYITKPVDLPKLFSLMRVWIAQ